MATFYITEFPKFGGKLDACLIYSKTIQAMVQVETAFGCSSVHFLVHFWTRNLEKRVL